MNVEEGIALFDDKTFYLQLYGINCNQSFHCNNDIGTYTFILRR